MIDAELADAYDSAGTLLDDYLRFDDAGRRAVLRSLRPSADELCGFFLESVVDDVLDGYHTLWEDDPLWPVEPGVEPIVACARGREFRLGSMTTRYFPGGYRAVARLLQPNAVWVTWRFYARGRPTVGSFDGLVRVGAGPWRWCPRPWRILPQAPRETAWLFAD